ncbi:hypothetical protein [Thioflexithrix psekupsensis]|uniref:Uncharacterized protein n=1 Tax=Thioflexithrix psekupsensis TaxID=1570016 RepID=A0A251X812_9GAMM|nr:hypothetical protein [Thioflexithrix psekupsensis]OUD14189.1 hypothetical protein TPSD3_07615 [Thioflexithrix psekupsensis]
MAKITNLVKAAFYKANNKDKQQQTQAATPIHAAPSRQENNGVYFYFVLLNKTELFLQRIAIKSTLLTQQKVRKRIKNGANRVILDVKSKRAYRRFILHLSK